MVYTQDVEDQNKANEPDPVVLFTQWTDFHYEQPEPRGFYNSGVLCYRNSALIALLHAPAVVNWFFLHREEECAINVCLQCFLRVLFEEYWLHRESKLSLENQLHCFSSTFNLLNSNCSFADETRQQDVWEYLSQVIEELNVQLQSSTKPNPVPSLFRVGLEYRRTCESCEAIDITAPDNLDEGYSLGAAINHDANLLQAIKRYLYDPDDKIEWTCKRCQTKNKTARRGVIRESPEVLFVHVNRFQERPEKGTRKLKRKIKFEESLDLAKCSRDSSGKAPRYELFAVIYHRGDSISNGHYYTYTRGPTREWSRINDEKVRKVTFKEVSESQTDKDTVYVLAYHRASEGAPPGLSSWDGQPPIREDTKLSTAPELSDSRHVAVHGQLTVSGRNMVGEIGGGLILPGTEPLVYLEHRRRVQPATLEIDMRMGSSRLAGTLKGSLNAVLDQTRPVPHPLPAQLGPPQLATLQAAPTQGPGDTILGTAHKDEIAPKPKIWKLTEPKPPTPKQPLNKRKRPKAEENEGSAIPTGPTAKRQKSGRKPKAKKNEATSDGKPKKKKKGQQKPNGEAEVSKTATPVAERLQSVAETGEPPRPLKLKINLKNLGMQADAPKKATDKSAPENGEERQVYRGEEKARVHFQLPEEDRGNTSGFLEDDRVQEQSQPAAEAPLLAELQQLLKPPPREGARKNPRRKEKK